MKLAGTFEARNTLPTGDSYTIPLVIEEIESSYRLIDDQTILCTGIQSLGCLETKLHTKASSLLGKTGLGMT